MTISEKKIELVQGLLLLQDQTTLFEIERLINTAFNRLKSQNIAFPGLQAPLPSTFEEWAAQFDDPEHIEHSDEFEMNIGQFRQRIWAAEQGTEMSLDEFFERIAQN